MLFYLQSFTNAARYSVSNGLQISFSFQLPTWLDSLKQINRRSKAGFDSIHEELLLRSKQTGTQAQTYRNPRFKQLVKKHRTSLRLFGNKTKFKESPETTRQTFISYVDQDDCSDASKSGSASAFGFASTTNTNLKFDKKSPKLIDTNSKQCNNAIEKEQTENSNYDTIVIATMDDLKLEKPDVSNAKYLRPRKYSLNIYDEPNKPSPRRMSCVASNESHNLNINRLLCTQANDDDQPTYANLVEVSTSQNIYETPGSPVSSEAVDVSKTLLDKKYSNAFDNEVQSEGAIYANIQDYATSTSNSESDNDYIDMQGVNKTDSLRRMIFSCPAINDERNLYANTGQLKETSLIQASKSAPPSPSANSLRKSYHNSICHISDDENVYIFPDPVRETPDKTPKSAIVKPYIPEVKPPTVTLPQRPLSFFSYSVEEVAQCFEVCALPNLSKLCREEQLDGEYFKYLTDEELTEEPFYLKPFHVSKVRKIIEGWRPRRMSIY